MKSRDELLARAEALLQEATPKATSDACKKHQMRFIDWGGHLPSNVEEILCYLADHEDSHSMQTLRAWVWGIGQFHLDMKLDNPAADPRVKLMLRGIAAAHAGERTPEQAEALPATWVAAVYDYLGKQALECSGTERHRALRDRCLFSLAWWYGLRADSVTSIQVEGCSLKHDHDRNETYAAVFVPSVKDDKENIGRKLIYTRESLMDPVGALEDYLQLAVSDGPLFYHIDQWGNVNNQKPLSTRSVSTILVRRLEEIGVNTKGYSSHSFRSGYATWTSSFMHVKQIMERVGWENIQNAMRYIRPSVDERAKADAMEAVRVNAQLLLESTSVAAGVNAR